MPAAPTLDLSTRDRAMLRGDDGPAVALAMRVITRVAGSMDAERLLDISGAHIDSCLYHGQAGLDFAQRLADDGAEVIVPTTLNVSSLDLLHPELYRGDDHTRAQARALMAAYERMGCRPTWTCAPYQLPERPAFGDHIAWAESNAIVFANAVLGARTHRYGDFIDICCAITGRAPAAGLHLDEHRRARVVFDLSTVPDRLLALDVAWPLIGLHVGRVAGTRVPALTGLPEHLGPVSEDRLKALGAAGASSGPLAHFHVVGSTPEAPTLAAALGTDPADAAASGVETLTITPADLRRARDQLTTVDAGPATPLGIVSLGTPHYSVAEIVRLHELLDGRPVHPDVDVYVNTGRDTLHEIQLRGLETALRDAGVTFVVDTCTYITPVMARRAGAAMTDSGKWAYYAPGNIGASVVFGGVEDCVESMVAGEIRRDPSVWGDA